MFEFVSLIQGCIVAHQYAKWRKKLDLMLRCIGPEVSPARPVSNCGPDSCRNRGAVEVYLKCGKWSWLISFLATHGSRSSVLRRGISSGKRNQTVEDEQRDITQRCSQLDRAELWLSARTSEKHHCHGYTSRRPEWACQSLIQTDLIKRSSQARRRRITTSVRQPYPSPLAATQPSHDH